MKFRENGKFFLRRSVVILKLYSLIENTVLTMHPKIAIRH